MYLLGYSLDNLSLMALTISTGFVVDDAIVMIENISRYIEMGERPMTAALKGAAEIGFTIVSLTVSLIAVLIPLLFMADIVGRLFREFAVTLGRDHHDVGLRFIDADAHDGGPVFFKHKPESEQGRFYHWSEISFQQDHREVTGFMLKYRAAPSTRHDPDCHRHPGRRQYICSFYHSEGLLSGTGYRRDSGGSQKRRISISFPSIGGATAETREGGQIQIPAVESLDVLRRCRRSLTLQPNNGRIQITLKPLEERDASNGRYHSAPAAQSGAGGWHQPLHASGPGSDKLENRVDPHAIPVHAGRHPRRLNWASGVPKLLDPMENRSRILQDVASDQLTGGLGLELEIDRDTAARFGITPQNIDDTLYDAFGQRQVSTIFTQLNQYHVVLESRPKWQLTATLCTTSASSLDRRARRR